jgi:hypothetical protein
LSLTFIYHLKNVCFEVFFGVALIVGISMVENDFTYPNAATYIVNNIARILN